jgi:alcohol dehydrogenase class IV
MEAVGVARRESCDFFIGLGGGSSIDTAEARHGILPRARQADG